MKLVDNIVRRIARSFLLKYVDGYKTQIFRVVQAVNSVLVGAYLLCPHIPEINGVLACSYVDQLNAQWLALSVFLGQLGLEFGIVDARIKARLKEQ